MVKLTPELIYFLDDLTNKYCKQMSIDIKPLIITSTENLPNKGMKISVSLSMRNDKECLALHYPSTEELKPDLIFLDVGRHKNKKQLEKTLVHELCHTKFGAGHWKEFYDNIELVLKGKQF